MIAAITAAATAGCVVGQRQTPVAAAPAEPATWDADGLLERLGPPHEVVKNDDGETWVYFVVRTQTLPRVTTPSYSDQPIEQETPAQTTTYTERVEYRIDPISSAALEVDGGA